MKLNFFKLSLLSSFVVLLSACLDTTTETTAISSNPCFVSLTFAANDSIPNIEDAVFTLEYDALLNDSIIVNLDSLPYQTRIDSVNPTFSFYSTAGARLIFEKDSVDISGTDTIDFSQSVKLRNYASDGVTSKAYNIKVNVHKVEPEWYVWSKVIDLDTHQATSQKAIVLKNILFYYLNNGTTNYLYKSADGYNWTTAPVSNLPNNVTFSDLTAFNDSLYITDNNFIYKSANGSDWTAQSVTNYNVKSILFSLNSKLWAVTQSKSDNSKYYFANSSDGIVWAVITSNVIPDRFPVNDFSALSFSSRTGKPKAIVIGGTDSESKIMSWSTENGTYWTTFSIENNTLDTLATGASIIPYDNKLLLFGKRTDKVSNHFKQSIDEGLSWQIPDSTYNYLPTNYNYRSYQSAIVFKPATYNATIPLVEKQTTNRIFVIGGKNETGILSDIWTGKLNRKNFMIQ